MQNVSIVFHQSFVLSEIQNFYVRANLPPMSTYFTRLMITVRIVRRNMIPSYKYAHKIQETVYQDDYISQHEMKLKCINCIV